jgi:type III secretion protein C
MMVGKLVAQSRKLARPFTAFMAVAALSATAALAADPPFPSKRITLNPVQQPVADTIMDLFTQAGLSVKVSNRFEGRMSAKWVGTPSEIWRQIAKSSNAVAYYDGSVVRVYHASEISSRTISAADPKSVEQQAIRMRLVGAGNIVKSGKGAVVASGVPAFLESIAQLASRSTAPSVAALPAVIPIKPPANIASKAAPVDSDIVSPLNKPSSTAAASMPLPLPVSATAALPPPYQLDYVVSRRAGTGFPYEIRIYNLKYAKPEDRIINSGDYDVVIPGVASLLRQVMGGGVAGNVQIVNRDVQGARAYPDMPAGPYGNPYGYGYPPPYPPQQQQQPQPEAPMPDGPRITADQARGSVIVVDRPNHMENYDALIRNFDRPRSHVEIEVVMLDVTTSSSKSLGADWDFGFGGLGGIFGGSVVASGGGSGSNIQGTFVKSQTSFVNARITALNKKGRARVVTRPTLVTQENEPSVGDYRQTIPIRFSGQYQGGVKDYRVGVFMAITPKVAKEPDGLNISLQLDIRNGQINGVLPDGTPFFNQGLLTNNVSIRQGESLIIGGVTIDSDFEDRSKIPGLGDIPVAGQLFRKKSRESSRVERIIIVTPRVISDRPNNLIAAAPQAEDDEDEEEAEELAMKRRAAKRLTAKKKTKRTAS